MTSFPGAAPAASSDEVQQKVLQKTQENAQRLENEAFAQIRTLTAISPTEADRPEVRALLESIRRERANRSSQGIASVAAQEKTGMAAIREIARETNQIYQLEQEKIGEKEEDSDRDFSEQEGTSQSSGTSFSKATRRDKKTRPRFHAAAFKAAVRSNRIALPSAEAQKKTAAQAVAR